MGGDGKTVLEGWEEGRKEGWEESRKEIKSKPSYRITWGGVSHFITRNLNTLMLISTTWMIR